MLLYADRRVQTGFYSARCHLTTAVTEGWELPRFPPQLSVGVVSHVLHDGFQPQPGLLCSRDDLVGWQEETVAARVS